MEDRKRPALSSVDDLAPPSKRQAVNGGGKSRDDSGDMKEEAWIEQYQKGAIYRQMLEYKREKSNLEVRLQELEKKSVDHDDHIRILDAWWLQLVQEIELLVDGTISSSASSDFLLPTGLHFKDSKEFQRHLAEKGNVLKEKVDSLFSRLASRRGEVKPEVADLEAQVKSLLASQKEYIVQLDRLKAENEDLTDRCNTEILKVIKAERKLDRVRSAQVQKLEQQALANATTRPPVEGDGKGGAGESNGANEAVQQQYQEAIAVVAKQKEQLASALAEIKTLQEENSTLKARRDTLTDEDYVRTDVFKHFRSQNEDLIKRINHLEATNKQLREEAERLQAERTSFRDQLEREAQSLTLELEDQLQAKEQDLTRIRSARDELLSENSQLKQIQSQERASLEQLRELSSATADRVKELESELERLRPSEEGATMSEPRPDLEQLSLEELRQKYVKLERDFQAINKELPLLEKSYKKAMSLAQKKVMDFGALEDRIAQLTAEKSKADQKYFAARKDMDIRNGEIRSLRLSNGKSSDIISQLKEAEAHSRSVISNLEKQIVDLKQSNSSIFAENKRLETSSADANRRADAMKAQITDLSNLVKARDAATTQMREQLMALESELEKLRVRVDHLTKDRDHWKTKCLSNSSSEEEMLRNLVICSVCRSNFKNSILKTCGHVFCNECIESRIANRMRKCPSCNKAFDKVDVMAAHL
ncbi:hypothetical protein VTK73DRAFT_7472 [Phialemonium thermophilum]|uniref:E3 ubiquitin protein ligase n=1 Tax=Phialemonium thermophilum TaxID=223376 RepID=A0ABR3XSX1_9PEZI